MQTARLELESIMPCHAERLFHLMQEPSLYLYIPQEPPENIDQLRTRYTRWSKGGSDDGAEIWLNYALLNRNNAHYIGTVQATINKENLTASIAYEIYPAFQRQGFARDACIKLIEILSHEFGVTTIESYMDTRNLASIALVESLGFKRIKKIENADHFKGEDSDEFVYRCLVHSH